MKKVLLATSALVAAGFVTSASAAEWETGVSGYYFLGLAVTDSNAQDGIGVLRDGEIHFNGRLTADNGLTFRARVELESHTTGDQIDENWGSVSGSFGTVVIGGDNTVGYEQVAGRGIIYAPGARIGYADSFALTTAAGVAFSASPGVANDSIGIHYSSPSFMGFAIHGSYLPSAATDGGGDTNNPVFASDNEVWSLAASYDGDFGDFSFGIAGHYTDIEGVRGEQLGVGLNVGFSGFTIAGFYEDDFVGDIFGIGAQYATGPWTIGGGYSHGSSNNAQDNDIAAGWVTYTAAPGVLFTVGVEFADDDATNNSNFGGLAFMTLRF